MIRLGVFIFTKNCNYSIPNTFCQNIFISSIIIKIFYALYLSSKKDFLLIKIISIIIDFNDCHIIKYAF